ncbi:MAG: hypothetical protein CVU03_09305 [Bacteroidetes bacterium HGW-Bacteroidetes-2]|jgi:hypothetical protein|nr:MAG: hypothetical protein CVU08_15825 [Bacteroidetes bacterium HGW-Bacteroidetes-3]PKP25102.1 MAG: hypothetical protein CVU03_09305 [Bacteroidetes bacterium HGW-Bacteroidetes-2]
MITRTKLKEQIDSFPEQFSIDELIERLILIEKIEKGKIQSENNEILTDNELDKEIHKCVSFP